MKKFMAMFLAPPTVIEDWMKTPEADRKAATEKMQADWGRWMAAHADMITSTEAGGKTKRVTPGGVSDVKNEVMLYSFVEAESHEDAAKAFADHPHLGIPQASIEVMEVRAM